MCLVRPQGRGLSDLQLLFCVHVRLPQRGASTQAFMASLEAKYGGGEKRGHGSKGGSKKQVRIRGLRQQVLSLLREGKWRKGVRAAKGTGGRQFNCAWCGICLQGLVCFHHELAVSKEDRAATSVWCVTCCCHCFNDQSAIATSLALAGLQQLLSLPML